MDFDAIRFTLDEILSLIGLTQCVYLIVYILFRSGPHSRISIPVSYFFLLGCAFFLDVSSRFIGEITPYFTFLRDFLWLLCVPLGLLLAIQVVFVSKLPSFRYYFALFVYFMAVPVAYLISLQYVECQTSFPCDLFGQFFILFGSLGGGLCLLMFWLERRQLANVRFESSMGNERFWLIMALLAMNTALLACMMAMLAFDIPYNTTSLIRTVIGLAFIYLANTSLLRIYPQAVILRPDTQKTVGDLSEDERELAKQIENLMTLDKLYQEPSFSRSDLARELNCSEAVLSKVINGHFKKTFPQLLNDHRVQDAMRMLRQTDADMQTIAGDVGFNSLATFNRVFKDVTGVSPSEYRNNH